MKFQLTALLFAVLLLTFSFGTYLTFGNTIASFYFLLYYSTALYILRRALTDDFYLSVEKNRFQVSESKVLLHGESLPVTSREDIQEERYLNQFNLAAMAKRQFFTYFLLALAVFLLFYIGNVPVGLTSMIPVICGLLFIKSVYVGHLLFPLGLNIYSVIAHYDKDQDTPVTVYAIYVLLVFLTLHMMSKLSGEHVKWKKNFSILPVTLLFCVSVYGLNYFFDADSKKEQINKDLAPVNKAVREVKRQSHSALSKLASLPDSTFTDSFKNKMADHLQDISRFENMQGLSSEKKEHFQKIMRNNNDLMKEAEELKSGVLERSNGAMSAELEELSKRHGAGQEETLTKLKEELAKSQEDLTSLQKNLMSSAPNEEQASQMKELETRRQELKSQFERMSNLSPQERQALQDFAKKKQDDLKLIQKLGSNPDAISEQMKNLKDLEELSGRPQPTSVDLKEIAEKLEATKQIDRLKNEVSRTEPLKSSSENQREALKAFDKKEFNWKKLIPPLMLLLAFFIFSHFLRKKGIKEIQIHDPDLLEELKTQWKDLKKLKLSPREEVIHFYNILHDIFQKVHYQEHETPPSCIVFQDMKDFNPKLDRATYLVTEIYCRCFYGNKEVTNPDLKSFRKAVNSILHVYGIE